jgi:hypothetical protein
MDVSLRKVVAAVLVVAGLATLCVVHLSGNPIPGYGLRRSPEAARQESSLAQIDRLAASAVTGEGNVFLEFRGFDGNVPFDEQFMSMVYYRAVNAAHPVRVFVARPTDVVNNGAGITRAAFTPDGAWFNDHDVRSIVTFSRDSSGGIRSNVQRIGAGAAVPREVGNPP